MTLLRLLLLVCPAVLRADITRDVTQTIRENNISSAYIFVAASEGPDPLRIATDDQDPHMRMGSVSKLFVGTLTLLLAEENLLDLDAPISQYVDGVPNGDAITLAMLGYQRSGLPDAIRNPDFQNALNTAPDRYWTPTEILKFAFSQTPYFTPDEKFGYSNTNSILLALAAEKATGEPFSSLVCRYILDPLAVTPLDIALVPSSGLPTPHPKAFRHGKKNHPIGYGDVLFDATTWSSSWTHAAGNFYAKPSALAAIADTLISGCLLTPSSRKRFHHFQPTGRHDWLYGFQIEKWDGFIGHRGDVPGYSALIAQHIATNRTFTALTNLSNLPDGRSPASLLLEVASKSSRSEKK